MKHDAAPPWRVPGRIAYVVGVSADAALPQQAHTLVQGLSSRDYSVVVVQLLVDAARGRAEGSVTSSVVDGVRYLQLSLPGGANAQAIAGLLRVFKPSVVVLALDPLSNQASKLAALHCKLPLVYEKARETADAPAAQSTLSKDEAVYTLRDAADFESILQAIRFFPASQLRPPRQLGAAGRLRVAAVMDEFTYHSYAPECELFQLTPANALSELEQFNPQLLFIESAWRGKDDLWDRKIGTLSSELKEVIAWCKRRHVPTIFWNKEDPVHFETFLTTAQQFDFVFTTDIDCIGRYKAALGHERVYLLPFAAQPRTHNPIELYERKDAFCFAGAYYVRYPDRIRDLENYVAELPKFSPLEIYDRNFGKNDVNYQFPPAYQPYIVGTLPFHEIDKAYKGYRYAINLNSIKQSQTMFARRLYELLASNTVTVSNFSRGVRLMFGDLVVTTDSGTEMVQRLQRLAGDAETSGKLRLAALRKVMLEHTYAHRLAYIASKALKRPMLNTLPNMLVVAYATSAAQCTTVLSQFQHQTHSKLRLVLVLGQDCAAADLSDATADSRITLLSQAQASAATLQSLLQAGEWVAPMLAQDYYGPNYLLDLAVATRYSHAQLVGKQAHFLVGKAGISLLQPDAAYRPAAKLPARASAMQGTALPITPLIKWLSGLATVQWQHPSALAIDPYNYCRNGAAASSVEVLQQRVDDAPLYPGLHIDQLLATAEGIAALEHADDPSKHYKPAQLAGFFGNIKSSAINFELLPDRWQVTSQLADDKHEYVYASKEIPLAALQSNKEVQTYLDASPGLNIQLVIVFLDASKAKISHSIQSANRNYTTSIPPNTALIRVGLRFYGSGKAHISMLQWSHRKLEPTTLLGQSKHLVLTNHYPAYDDLYRNAFVHSRVRAYREKGLRVDVFRLREETSLSYHEFEDADVLTGGKTALEKMLAGGCYESVLVHFLDAAMWQVLQKYIDRIRVVVWVHGSEIQPWHRRDFNYANEGEREVAKAQSDIRMTFWRNLFQTLPPNLNFVFVSRYFAEEVMTDVGSRLPEGRYEIIHNPIDTELFDYIPKPIEQRKRILSIRPYASAKYANDLSVKAILELAKRPYFSELEFRMIGEGPLFDEILAPLRGFPNVTIERRFLNQIEIAQLHKSYGVFLSPTRMDSQGVSRDEAMASGLVPITNAVTAIPEFVDAECGVLSASEDHIGLAQGIEVSYLNPDRFADWSTKAAGRVRQQSGKNIVIERELRMITKTYKAKE